MECVATIAARPEPWKGGRVHAGALQMYRTLRQSLYRPVLGPLLRSESLKGYGLSFVGHSMGAGVAALAAHDAPSALGIAKDRVDAWCFSTPAFFSPSLSEEMVQHGIRSIVHGDDMVPRLHLESIAALKLDVMRDPSIDYQSEIRHVAGSVMAALAPQAPALLPEGWYDRATSLRRGLGYGLGRLPWALQGLLGALGRVTTGSNATSTAAPATADTMTSRSDTPS